jgi:hypothetical protein
LIIGNINSVTYKEIFPYIKNNQMWIGPSITSGDRKFFVPDDYPLNAAGCGIDSEGKRYIRVKGVRWFTNLEIPKRNEELDLVCRYSEDEYPHYENYDAIEVGKTADIPCDYQGVMGVPITFLDKYCPSQFEILGISLQLGTNKPVDLPKEKQGGPAFYTKENGTYNRKYCRIVIRNKHPQAL